jgi:glycolate oxidase FAD binding subunit
MTASVVSPADVQELTQIVQSAIDARTALQVVGGDTKRSIGIPARQTLRVSTAKLDRIIDYDPAELVLTTGTGVKLSAIQTLLASQDQMLAFEPYDFASIAGVSEGSSTIGGVVAAGLAGSRRVSAGNVRDHVLGFTAVSGRGEAFVAGGRVVKNVTGYDVSKLMCGSWGQLAVLTQVTLKVLPRPRVSLTFCARGLDDDHAYAMMTAGLRSQADVSAAAHAPSELLQVGSLVGSMTLLRLEGFGPSVEARARLLREVIAMPLAQLEPRVADEIWTRVCCATSMMRDTNDVLWRICVPSTRGARVCGRLRELGAVLSVDWGGALIWARFDALVEAQQVRSIAEQAGGHATLLRAPDDYRSRVSALHPEAPGVAALTQRVKASFDPAGILDPDRFAVRPI